MEVQVPFMMTRNVMRFLNNRLVLSIAVLCIGMRISAQDWRVFNEKDKAANEAERKHDYATAIKLCEDIIAMTIDATSEDDSRFNIKGHAYFRLGIYYLYARHFSYNLNKAIYNFEKAAECRYSHARAEMYLAMIYNIDAYGVKDLNKSILWIKKGSERCATLEYMLAEIYEKGSTYFLINDTGYIDNNGRRLGSSNVKIRSKTLLTFPDITLNKKKAYEHYYNYIERNSCYVKPDFSRYEIGVALMDGTYLDKDYSKAFEFFRYSAPSISELSENIESYQNSKTADTLWRLSVLYRFGLGTTDNEEKANIYLKYAALCGSPSAKKVIDAGIINNK